MAGVAYVGAVVGALIGLHIPKTAFNPIILVCLVLVGAYTLLKPQLGTSTALRWDGVRHTVAAMLTGFLIGVYDGALGPGTGSFLVFALVGLLGYAFLEASAKAKIANVATNLGALTVFAPGGHVVWGVGLLMGAANLAGGYLARARRSGSAAASSASSSSSSCRRSSCGSRCSCSASGPDPSCGPLSARRPSRCPSAQGGAPRARGVVRPSPTGPGGGDAGPGAARDRAVGWCDGSRAAAGRGHRPLSGPARKTLPFGSYLVQDVKRTNSADDCSPNGRSRDRPEPGPGIVERRG